MPRRTLLATTAALLISSGCNDESAVDEYGSSDGEAETSGDSQPPEVVGRWRTAGATATRTCGDDPIVVLPVPPLPAVEFTHAAGALTATLPDGCTVTMEAVESGATLVDDPGCTVQGPTGPFEQQLSAFTVTVRNEAEASLTLHADQQVDGRACEFEIIGDLTREDAERPAVEVVAEFGQGVFVEGIERDDDGTTWVTASQPDGSGLWRVPMDGDPEFVVAYPAGATGTLVRDAAGTLWTTLGSFDPAFVPALARLDGDALTIEVELPQGSAPNGITAATDGSLFVADSNLGRIWRFDPASDELEVWAEGGALAVGPLQASFGFPGPNGIKLYEDAVYVSNPSALSIVRVPRSADGTAGPSEVYASHIGIDDFAIDIDGNLWGTTHPFNGIVRVAPDGTKRIMIDSRDAAWGPTDAVFGQGEDAQRLFAVTDGNWFGSMLPAFFTESTQLQTSVLLRIDAGVVGAPEPG